MTGTGAVPWPAPGAAHGAVDVREPAVVPYSNSQLVRTSPSGFTLALSVAVLCPIEDAGSVSTVGADAASGVTVPLNGVRASARASPGATRASTPARSVSSPSSDAWEVTLPRGWWCMEKMVHELERMLLALGVEVHRREGLACL